MTSTTDATPPIFDGHNDILTKIYNAGGRKAVPRFADHPHRTDATTVAFDTG